MGFLSNIEKDLKALTRWLGGDEKEKKTPKKKIVKKTKRSRPKKKR
jgi:hypothetical protein